MRTYSDEAIVLARKNFGEADRILSVYSKNHGKIFLLAKGIRRPTSKKRGHLEVFSNIGFQASETKSLAILTEAETLDNFRKVRKHLNKISLAYFFTEVVGKITHEHGRNEGIYFLLLNYFKRLGEENKLKKLRTSFIKDLLVVTGFWPKEKILLNPDTILEEVLERNINSVRVGRKILN